MTIKHHPCYSTLMSCAAGSQPEALAAVVASHISMCPCCAAEVARMQEIGAVLFESLDAASVDTPCPIAAARAGEADMTFAPVKPCQRRGDVPGPIAPLVGPSLDEVRWTPLARGIWHRVLPLSECAKGYLQLVKVAPGRLLPVHGHCGEELTLLLRGSYTDETGTYDVGDLADLDDTVEHRPVADARTGCICLIASEKKARFKSILARLLRPFTGI